MKKIIAIILVVIGIFLFYKGAYQYIQENNSNNWPSTEGTILISEWKRATNGPHKAHIEYEYIVDNQAYESNFIHFAEFNPTNLVYKFKKNKKVPVYYNPHNPSEAVLITGASIKSISILIFMGLFFLIFSLITLFVKMPINKIEDV